MNSPVQFDQDTGDRMVRIRIHNELDGSGTELAFDRFPVRIGRNRGNDLVLPHEYVSNWHAAVGYVQRRLSLVQVGKSNSVRVDGRKMLPEEVVPLSGCEQIRIVPFAMVIREERPQTAPPPQPQPPPEPVGRAGPQPSAPPFGPPERRIRGTMLEPPDASGLGQQPHLPQQETAAAALAVLDHIAESYLGHRLEDPRAVAAMGHRLSVVLHDTLGFLVELQQGQRQFRSRMGIELSGDNPLELRDITPEELGTALLSPGDHGMGKALRGAMDVAKRHQVAILAGFEAGLRVLLRKLDPRNVAEEASRQFRLVSAKNLWETYQQIYADDAAEDAEVFKRVYGTAFRKAYARVVAPRARKRAR